MQIEIKKKIDMEKILEKAEIVHSVSYETKWFKEIKEVWSSFDFDLKKEWNKIKEKNRLLSISGIFRIPELGNVPLMIFRSGLIIGPPNLTQEDIRTIKRFILEDGGN